MKRIVLIGATLLAISGGIVAASYSASEPCCQECPAGVCKPGDHCPPCGENCSE